MQKKLLFDLPNELVEFAIDLNILMVWEILCQRYECAKVELKIT